jgi:hypothetical protein
MGRVSKKFIVNINDDKFIINSLAISSDKIGCDTYYGMKGKD